MSFFIDILDIIKLEGIENYMLLKNCGTVVSHNVKDPADMSTFFSSVGNSCNEMQKDEQFGLFRHVLINQKGSGSIILFGLGKYFLGIVSDSSVDDSELVTEIRKFITKISKS